MTLTEDIETQSNYEPKRALTITTHHTGSTSSRSNFNGTPPPPLMRGESTPRVDCGSPQVENHIGTTNKLSQFDFTSPIRDKFRSARNTFLPSYHSTSPTKPTPAHHRPASSIYSRTTSGEPAKKRFWHRQREEQDEEAQRVPEISYPLNVNPQFAHLVKPNLAHHPSVRRPENDFENKI